MRVISGCARGKKLKTIKGLKTRPTADRVKESLFNILQNRLPGAYCLDLFAGSGALGIEALSRGAQKCLFIEKSARCVKIIKENLLHCQLAHRGEVWHKDAVAALNLLAKCAPQFDLIFVDAPYGSSVLAPVLEKIALSKTLDRNGLLIVEHHGQDCLWQEQDFWRVYREKKYGNTMITFLVPGDEPKREE